MDKSFDAAKRLTELRRFFHRIPELAYQELKTQAAIAERLTEIGLSFRTVGTGIIARLPLDKDKTLAFRADIDALPIHEQNDVPYCSQHPGTMHACGHDGHIALLLTFAAWCAQNKAQLTVNCVFIFQPAEETEGGAITMIESGVLDGVDEIYAVHVDPALPAGSADIRAGARMAGAYEFNLVFKGASCHCADKQLGIDALRACTVTVNNIYEGLPKNLKGKALFHCGKLAAGYARNVVADEAKAFCTFRYFDQKHLDQMLALIGLALSMAQDEFGVSAKLETLVNYIPLKNNARCAAKAAQYLQTADVPPRFSAEDFAFYLQETDGCLIWLGVGGEGAPKKLHAPDFDFDEQALLHGLSLYQKLVQCNP